jgi:hypothetical protein
MGVWGLEGIALETMESALDSSDLTQVIFMGRGPFFFLILLYRFINK